MKEKMEKIMKELQSISNQWKSLSKFIKRVEKWKFQYMCFVLFLRNEKIKSKIMEDLTKHTEEINKNKDLSDQ